MATYTATLTDGTKQTLKVSSKAQLNIKLEEIGNSKVVRVDRVVPLTQTLKQAFKIRFNVDFNSVKISKKDDGYYCIRAEVIPAELMVMAYEIGLKVANDPLSDEAKASGNFRYGNISNMAVTLMRSQWEDVLKHIASKNPKSFKPELRKRME